MKHWLIALLLALVAPLALAQSEESSASAQDIYPLASEAERQRFDRLLDELRCPKCQNQNIADSDAPIAEDMREEVYRMVKEGADEQTVVDSMVDRFGEFVHYKPAFDARTALLWLLPAIVILIGLVVIVVIVRRSGNGGDDDGAGLTDEQRRQADELLRRQ
ncbi:cytochrome c-type biogenesis protein [Marinobacter sp.]|uniref:cytochrome c-type biogenesis protein n=1 Tax=Marinobacter sp. TaxID=50741 RepID=UPI003569A3DD